MGEISDFPGSITCRSDDWAGRWAVVASGLKSSARRVSPHYSPLGRCRVRLPTDSPLLPKSRTWRPYRGPYTHAHVISHSGADNGGHIEPHHTPNPQHALVLW